VTDHLRKVLADGRLDEALGMVEALLAQLRAWNSELELQLLKLRKHHLPREEVILEPSAEEKLCAIVSWPRTHVPCLLPPLIVAPLPISIQQHSTPVH
jgi:hypothetical protein